MSAGYTIRAVAAKTGLSTHAIRAWEKRYGALVPHRSETNRRLYGDEDIERLVLLRKALESGHTISRVANLPIEQLRSMAGDSSKRHDEHSHVAACMDAVDRLDSAALEAELSRAAAELGVLALLSRVVLPLIAKVDESWVSGALRISQEHLASATLRTYLEKVRSGIPPTPQAPRLLVTTPAGQVHELGALIVAILGSLMGWNVLYLGPNLPAREIADAALQYGARAVGLSLVYPDDDPQLDAELRELRSRLGPAVVLLVGGRAADAYSETLQGIGAVQANNLELLQVTLERLRSRAA